MKMKETPERVYHHHLGYKVAQNHNFGLSLLCLGIPMLYQAGCIVADDLDLIKIHKGFIRQ
jgi:hypothetical protein